MPIYCYECSYCRHEFEEYHSIKDGNSGKTDCHKCGNISFKVPAIFSPKIFKKREFGDGTSTPDFVRTPKQEKAWLRSQGITYDAPTGREKFNQKQERNKKSQTVMEKAFADALSKAEQGYKVDTNKAREVNPNAMRFRVEEGQKRKKG